LVGRSVGRSSAGTPRMRWSWAEQQQRRSTSLDALSGTGNT
jgi:hypothetical protein